MDEIVMYGIRQRSMRERQEWAYGQHLEGVPMKEIAELLGLARTTTSEYVAEARRREERETE